MTDPSHKAKTSASEVAFWKGFADEMVKISADATGLSSSLKLARRPRMGLPPATSKPVVKEPEPPTATLDHLGSTRTMQPPPVTSG